MKNDDEARRVLGEIFTVLIRGGGRVKSFQEAENAILAKFTLRDCANCGKRYPGAVIDMDESGKCPKCGKHLTKPAPRLPTVRSDEGERSAKGGQTVNNWCEHMRYAEGVQVIRSGGGASYYPVKNVECCPICSEPQPMPFKSSAPKGRPLVWCDWCERVVTPKHELAHFDVEKPILDSTGKPVVVGE